MRCGQSAGTDRRADNIRSRQPAANNRASAGRRTTISLAGYRERGVGADRRCEIERGDLILNHRRYRAGAARSLGSNADGHHARTGRIWRTDASDQPQTCVNRHSLPADRRNECGQPLASEIGGKHHGNRSIGRVDVEIYCDSFTPLPRVFGGTCVISFSY